MLVTRELPKYQGAIITVWATQIIGIVPNENGAMLIPKDEGFMPIQVDAYYMECHKPRIGGYYVVYPGGAKSYSEPDVFERMYSSIN